MTTSHSPGIGDSLAFGDIDQHRLQGAKHILWGVSALLIILLIWAYFANLDEVSTGSGRVVPTMREQVVQSLEGGILKRLLVRQDDIVTPGQILAELDPTVTEASVAESEAKYRAAIARIARLDAEVNQTAIQFPAELAAFPDLKNHENSLFQARRRGLEESTRLIRESLRLLNSELRIGQSLVSVGAASNVEILRLQQKIADLQLREADLQSEYVVTAREELSVARAEADALSSVIRGRADALARLTHRSPVRGIVKNIEVSTVGGVIPPNGRLMEIIPLDDQLLIEARMSPRDIAFIHPGQRASVKITAYDYAIYGALTGRVSSISPDTIQDEARPDVHYYRVFIRTSSNALVNAHNQRFPILPGMIATVDVHTGSKTVLEYIIKPFNRAREALRER